MVMDPKATIIQSRCQTDTLNCFSKVQFHKMITGWVRHKMINTTTCCHFHLSLKKHTKLYACFSSKTCNYKLSLLKHTGLPSKLCSAFEPLYMISASTIFWSDLICLELHQSVFSKLVHYIRKLLFTELFWLKKKKVFSPPQLTSRKHSPYPLCSGWEKRGKDILWTVLISILSLLTLSYTFRGQ